jgi:hypothetical protein
MVTDYLPNQTSGRSATTFVAANLLFSLSLNPWLELAYSYSSPQALIKATSMRDFSG